MAFGGGALSIKKLHIDIAEKALRGFSTKPKKPLFRLIPIVVTLILSKSSLFGLAYESSQTPNMCSL